jgi:hypothetical protein
MVEAGCEAKIMEAGNGSKELKVATEANNRMWQPHQMI